MSGWKGFENILPLTRRTNARRPLARSAVVSGETGNIGMTSVSEESPRISRITR